MKLRSLYILSIVGLLLVIVVQIGGMMYAYDNTKKEAERALNECFRLAFIETVDNEINNLPFPDMTIPFYSYLSKDSIRSFEDEMFLNYQQAASFLEDVYHVAIPLDVMARLVEKKLKWKNIDRTVNIRPATDRSKRSVYVRFKSVLSEKAWLNEKKGEAIEAVMFSPFIPLVKDIVFLFLPTLLLVVFLVYSWARQMDSILKQGNDIEKQRSAFYVLAEKMRLPIGEVRSQISESRWADIEASGQHLLDMTEHTLTGAKQSEWQRQVRKQYSESEFLAAMVPIYSSMRTLTEHSNWWDLEETTDVCVTPVKNHGLWYDGGIYIRLHQHSWMEEDAHLNNIWNALYSGVSSANRVLYQFENSTIEMNGKENYIAELKVARAFYYYLLLEAFGNVPIIDRFDVPDGYLPATEPRSKVFEFVESELKNNINNLSEDVLNTYGRFNKWNAKMLLARLYLNAEAWIGTPMYNECENLCNEIIATNKYRLDGDYSLPFSTNNELSNETMFVIPFDETKSGGQIYMWARKTLHYSQMQTFNLQATWLDGGCVGVPTFFDNYIEGDKRLEKTWRMGQQYALDGTPLWTNGWCGDPQMLLSYTKDVTNISGDATMYQGYRFGKYEIKIGATGTPDNDYVIMRYAEVLMMKAECILRTGGSSQEAAELVNEVRRRNFDTTNELTGSELEATTICNGVPVKYGRFLQELGVEFALEGLRRSQLIRFDNNFTKGTWWEHQPTNDTKRNLMLIPFDQLQRNSNLVQNPK